LSLGYNLAAVDKRYQVFVSSTFVDLQEERQAVMQALLELDCIPAGMELFPASDETAWELIKRVIEGCDYYVVIVGGRYGSRDAEGVSYTEREYDHAVSQGIPVLGFVHANPSEIIAGKTELDADGQAKLAAFREKVLTKHCAKWKSAEELGSRVSRSLIQTMKLDPREGWVRARYASSPEPINELRGQIDELKRELENARVKPPVSAEGLANGNDAFEIRYERGPNRFQLTAHKHVLAWDSIVAVVGPLMLNEAHEAGMKLALENKLAELAKVSSDGFVRINVEDFQTIKVQLLALGIIQQSERKRTASDTNTYWTLTAYGRHYTMTLKAIRSPGAALEALARRGSVSETSGAGNDGSE